MSPLKAALWSLLPSLGVGAVIGITSTLSRIVDRAYVIAAGFLVIAAGYTIQATLLHPNSHLWVLMLGAALLACGAVSVSALGNELMLGAIPPDRAGAAAAMNETVTELGGALGMAVMGSIGAAVYRRSLGTTLPASARSTLANAATSAAQEPSTTLPVPARSSLGSAATSAAQGPGTTLPTPPRPTLANAIASAAQVPSTADPAPARSSLGGAVAAAAQESGAAGARLLSAAREAFGHSVNMVSIVGAAIMAMAALLTILFPRRLDSGMPVVAPVTTPVAQPDQAAGAIAP